jgi:hypothetical protein
MFEDDGRLDILHIICIQMKMNLLLSTRTLLLLSKRLSVDEQVPVAAP